MGGGVSGWATIGEAYAAVGYKGGGEASRQGAIRATNKYSFVVWACEIRALGITTRDRILWGEEVYNIRELDGGRGGAADSEVIAESGVSQ